MVVDFHFSKARITNLSNRNSERSSAYGGVDAIYKMALEDWMQCRKKGDKEREMEEGRLAKH